MKRATDAVRFEIREWIKLYRILKSHIGILDYKNNGLPKASPILRLLCEKNTKKLLIYCFAALSV